MHTPQDHPARHSVRKYIRTVLRICRLDDAYASSKTRLMHTFEWTGCVFGLAGAWLLGTPYAAYGWGAFFVANLALIAFARGARATGLLVQQIGFIATTLHGLLHAWWPHIKG